MLFTVIVLSATLQIGIFASLTVLISDDTLMAKLFKCMMNNFGAHTLTLFFSLSGPWTCSVVYFFALWD